MPKIGQTISHYRILEKIGQGGMGEVYLADDTTLERKVALQFLPETFTSDPERMARFEREAKLLASLNHPNIAVIYGLEQADGKRFLVLEYVEGETLQARISKRALPVEEALAVCRQIAEGLEAAHEKGVIHRDLKPANVMITGEENVKILDFGLAKALADEIQSVDSSQSPTITEAMTQPGVVLGTAAYMSPEQAKGKAVDKIADIWAFGCILYECLTGKKAFEGETVTETLASVIKEEPDFEKVPPEIQLLLKQCLAKDRKEKLRDIGDAMSLIVSLPESTIKSAPIKRTRLIGIWAAVSTILLLAAAILGVIYYSGQESAEAMFFQISVPPMPSDCRMAISPDGRSIAFTASSDSGASGLFIRELGSAAPTPIEATEGASHPFWSPDSRSVGFFAEGMLKKVDVSGGFPKTICEAPEAAMGGTWNSAGTIIFGQRSTGLHSVSVTGGKSSAISAIDEKELSHTFPYFLPDGSHYLYTAWQTTSKGSIYLASLDSKERRQLVANAVMASYVDPGYIFFQSRTTLFAQPFDPENLTFTGDEVSITDGLVVDGFGYGSFSASQTRLIYRSTIGQAHSQFVWFDRFGRELGYAYEPASYGSFDLSPDEKKIAVTKSDNVWLIELERNVFQQLTFDPTDSVDVVWFPDDLRIAFTSMRNGNADIYELNTGGDGAGTPIVNTDNDEWIEDCSRDGRYIAYDANDEIYILPLFGDRKPIPIVSAPGSQDEPHFSFDGKWLAYGSNESRTWQVYVVPFPEGGPKRQISGDGGAQPRWNGNGKELFYLALDGQMMAVDIKTNGSIVFESPRVLFDTGLDTVMPNVDQYDVTDDGKRFLILRPLADAISEPITLVLNWISLIKK